MEFTKAQRRYKVLFREQERLVEQGRKDAEIELELERIVVVFPSLREVKPQLSASTKAMLQHAATVADEECSPTPQLGAQDRVAPLPQTAPQVGPPPVASQAAAPAGRGGFSFLPIVLGAITFVNDLRKARPMIRPSQLLLLVLWAVAASVLHYSTVDACSVLGWMTDPFVGSLGVLGYTFASCLSQRRLSLQTFLIFYLRDLVPCMVTVFVTCTVTRSLLAVACI